MLDDMDKQIIKVVKKVYDEEFESGDISLKITVKVPKRIKEFPSENEDGEPTTQLYEYKALDFDHNITTTLKKVDKTTGHYYGNKELKIDDEGNFVEKPIKDPQISIFDKAE